MLFGSVSVHHCRMTDAKKRTKNPKATYQPYSKDRKAEYCKILRATGQPTTARVHVGVSAMTEKRHRDNDPEYAADVQTAIALFREEYIEAEIKRRAVDGVDEPVFGNNSDGEKVIVGWRKKYSDVLLLALAKRHMKDEYGDRVKVEQKVSGSLAVKEIGLDQLTRDSREDLRKILEREGHVGISEAEEPADSAGDE